MENSALTTLSQTPRLDPQSQNGFLHVFSFLDGCTAPFSCKPFLFTGAFRSQTCIAGIGRGCTKTNPISLSDLHNIAPLSLSLVSLNYDRGFGYMTIKHWVIGNIYLTDMS